MTTEGSPGFATLMLLIADSAQNSCRTIHMNRGFSDEEIDLPVLISLWHRNPEASPTSPQVSPSGPKISGIDRIPGFGISLQV